MPKFLENKLESEAAKKGFKGERKDRYVYGAMNNMGAMKGNEETKKGAAMEAKHEAQTEGAHDRGTRARAQTKERESKAEGEHKGFDGGHKSRY
jgi:hypothetical protein